MILFVNFAPLNFAGGAERWILDVGTSISKVEKVTLMDVHQSISNYYGKLVLSRPYKQRITFKTEKNKQKHLSLKASAFIPFTKEWRDARNSIKEARLIYIRFEVLELFIVAYLGGLSAVKKTIAGVHSPFIYKNPENWMDRFHNSVYTSHFSKWFLAQTKLVHVLNIHDENLFTKKFKLKNVVRIPNYVEIRKNTITAKSTGGKDNKLHIVFVGELNKRKGIDILIETITKSPSNFVFHIAGDGPFRQEIVKIDNDLQNVYYYGYLSKDQIFELYSKCDILFLPSRAESFSIALLEAMSQGLSIISSPETFLNLPAFIQQAPVKSTPDDYIKLFRNYEKRKPDKNKVAKYFLNNFTKEKILPVLSERIFQQ